MSYKDLVSVQQKATEYLENKNLFKEAIFADYPVYHGLQHNYMGYLKSREFTNVHTPFDSIPVTTKDNIKYCVIYDPATFKFNTLSFNVKEEIQFRSSYAVIGIYKVID